MEQTVEVRFDRKAIGAVEVDVPEGDRSNVRQDFSGRDRPTTFFSPLEYLMKLSGVVRDDGVGQQCKGPGNHDALELMHRFTSNQEPIDAAAEVGLSRVIGQVN